MKKYDKLPRTEKTTVYINGSTTLGVRVRGGKTGNQERI